MAQADRKTVISALEEIATLLELTGANPFKVRAFENGARALQSYEGDLAEGLESGELGEIKGVGKSILAEVRGLIEEGRAPGLEELREEVPEGLLEIVKIPGVGPKKARQLYDELGVESVGELEYACHENRLVSLKGFGEKSQQKILDGIEVVRKYAGRHLLSDAWTAAEGLLEQVRGLPGVERCELAGSLRRRKETVKDVDILVETTSPGELGEAFVALEQVEDVIGHGDTKVSVRLVGGLQVDLRMVEARAFPFALNYFTGSKEHNTVLRQRAKERGLKLNEYGLFPEGSDESLACADEAAIYGELGLRHVPPELREDHGEFEMAANGGFPELLEREDLRGALHNHSTWSDGADSIEDMARAARERGLEYFGLSDHSQTATYAHGLRPDDIAKQHDEIDEVNSKLEGITVLKGIESDILPDGSLDYDESVLEKFDFVVASVHGQFQLGEAEQTERCIKAVQNPFTSVLGHPTGRLLLGRDGFSVDMHAVLEAAAESGCAVELNANPRRLDIDWRLLKRARELGVLVSIGADAHRTSGLDDLRYGVAMARKGALSAGDVLNTRPLDELRAWLRARREG